MNKLISLSECIDKVPTAPLIPEGTVEEHCLEVDLSSMIAFNDLVTEEYKAYVTKAPVYYGRIFSLLRMKKGERFLLKDLENSIGAIMNEVVFSRGSEVGSIDDVKVILN